MLLLCRSVYAAANKQGKPSAWDIGVKFDFNLMNRANWLSANYSNAQNRGTWLPLLQTPLINNGYLVGTCKYLVILALLYNMVTYQLLMSSGTNPNSLNVFSIGANLYF